MANTGPKPRTWEEALEMIQDESYLDHETGCFIWTGHIAGLGYGIIRCENKQQYIHRLVYQRLVCADPVEVVRHKCDTPLCWNPKHLIGGTHAENVADKVERDRHLYGTRHYRASITEQQAKEIRRSDLSVKELTNKYNVTRSVVYGIWSGKNWNHV